MKNTKTANYKQPGRPSFIDNCKRCQVYLDEKSVKIAQKLGGGNISLGVRRALLNSNYHIDKTGEDI